jgi:2-C-methyl-D-erythritol 4-phosphate cytidylyltransferase/2-C-methyl-D-erythritol 2,4-cyclodiphosphate synthase
MKVSAIVVAGGRGERLGGSIPKQLRQLHGKTLLERSIIPFDILEDVHEIIVVLPHDLVVSQPDCLNQIWTDVRVVEGGERRQDSVALGFDAVSPDSDFILVHDAARPFCTTELVKRSLEAAIDCGAAIPAVGVQDSLKLGVLDSDFEIVERTISRERVFCAQTPQAFSKSVLFEAIEIGRSGVSCTDEAALAEKAGHQVRLVKGDPRNMKITTEADLLLAREMTPSVEHNVQIRVGLGYDLHRLVEDRPLILAGVTIPGSHGLHGHSDADVVCHAVADSVLGAAGAGDIGKHFPDDDPKWKNASSIELLGRVTKLVEELGVRVVNLDVVVITDWPKIRDYSDVMCQRLAQALNVSSNVVSIKGKTSEGVGALGRGEAIAVQAVALLEISGT